MIETNQPANGFRVSWHHTPPNDGNHREFSTAWCNYLCDWDLLQWLVCNRAWSPVVWSDMRRSGDNFKESDLCVLDFDDAANLDDAINYEFNDYQHIIGTTKRHDILGDRFRVVIPWDKKILGVDAFIDNMRYLAKNYGADIQASNAAVKFMPCTEVVSVKSSGDKMERLKRTKTRERYLEEKRIKQDGAKPWLIKWFMDNPVGDGERGTRCFQFGCEAVKASIERQDAFNMIIESGMISDWTDWNHHLVWQNLNGGYRHLRERSRD